MPHLVSLMVQIAVFVISAQICGALAQKYGQSKVIGEVIGGIILGPSLFGQLSPDLFHLVFTSTASPELDLLAEMGLVLLMFQIGLSFDSQHLKLGKNALSAVSIALGGMLLPFVLGIAVAWATHQALAPDYPFVSYALFIGIALSVTAVPVLARLLTDLGMADLHLARVAMLAAAITDLLAWIILGLLNSMLSKGGVLQAAFIQIGMLLCYLVFCWCLLRPCLRYLLRRMRENGERFGMSPVALFLVAALLSGVATSSLGLHGAFGGLLLGLMLCHDEALVAQWNRDMTSFINLFLVPVFFALAGAKMNWSNVDVWQSATWTGLFLVAAVAGKIVGCYGAGRATGMAHHPARLVAVLMNTRGLMELVILTIGLNLHLIPPQVYSMLMIVTVVTTVMTVPLVNRWRHAPELASIPNATYTRTT
jgi:Kef-type K+ transport system membrane component KefB